jgi:Holliday junction resolvase RusA-like endonuclease
MTNGQGATPRPIGLVPYQRVFIKGVPYGRWKVSGNKAAADVWSAEVIRQTNNMKRVLAACAMNVTFLLPEDKYQSNFQYGNDLDNLLKRLLDALANTVFAKAPGKDSCVVVLHAMKARVPPQRTSGAAMEILPIDV